MKELIVYHVVTEKPMYIGQHIRFDGNHHNGVWQRVNEKTDIVNDIYNCPDYYKNTVLEHHTAVALRELALEKVRMDKYPNFPSRLACLYVSKTLEVFYGDAENCFDGRLNEQENLMLADQYWNNKSFNNNSIIEMLVDGDIEVVEILKSKNYVQTKV